MTPAWNERAFSPLGQLQVPAVDFKPYWQFPQGLPLSNIDRQRRATRVAKALQARLAQQGAGPGGFQPLSNTFVTHLSRLCLMLADHHYSRLTDVKSAERVRVEPCNTLLANTKYGNEPNQSLDEHLVGVAQHGAEIARFLPRSSTIVAPGAPNRAQRPDPLDRHQHRSRTMPGGDVR